MPRSSVGDQPPLHPCSRLLLQPAAADEDHTAVVAAPIHPAAQLHGLAAGVLAQVAASVAAHR
jgi:hypothetical protein